MFSFQHFKRGFLQYYVGGFEKSTIFSAEMRMQTWRWTELLHVTTTGSQALTRRMHSHLVSC